MEQKAEMKKRGIRSSDTSDALCLTFAYPDSALQDTNSSNKLAATIMQGNKNQMKARSLYYGGSQTS